MKRPSNSTFIAESAIDRQRDAVERLHGGSRENAPRKNSITWGRAWSPSGKRFFIRQVMFAEFQLQMHQELEQGAAFVAST